MIILLLKIRLITLEKNPDKIRQIEEAAYLDVKKYNDWDKNYEYFINELLY